MKKWSTAEHKGLCQATTARIVQRRLGVRAAGPSRTAHDCRQKESVPSITSWIPLTIPRGMITVLPWALNTCRIQPGWGGWNQNFVRSSQEPSHGWTWHHGERPAQQGGEMTRSSLQTILSNMKLMTSLDRITWSKQKIWSKNLAFNHNVNFKLK